MQDNKSGHYGQLELFEMASQADVLFAQIYEIVDIQRMLIG